MANMTIENIGGFMRSGNVEKLLDRGQSIETPLAPSSADPTTGVTGKSFTEMLKDSIDKTNDIQIQADNAAKELAAGRNKNIHETMLMLEKADMSFKLMMQVRNKIIEAYREVMRMQV
jgi:flagellar hook-basal body complex protein FliE